jgi:uncharacterized protein
MHTGRPPDPAVADRRAPTWGLGEVLVGMAVAIAGASIVTTLIFAATDGRYETVTDLPLSLVAISQAGLWVGFLGVPIMAAKYKGAGAIQDFRIRFTGRDLWFGGLAGILLQLAVIPLVYAPLLWLLDRDVSDLEGPARELTERATDPIGVILLVLIVGVGAPIVEEVFYRGLFQGALLKRGMPGWLAVGTTSVVFAAMHLQALQFPALALFGLLAGTLAYRYGRLGPAIAAHITFNMVTVVVLLTWS